ncbi:MAG: LCP family protein [bacterium]|nr:LCP family protein [bacterium]
MTVKKKKFNYKLIVALFMNLLLLFSSGYLLYSILKLNGIENLVRYIFCIVYAIITIIICFFNIKSVAKKQLLRRVIFLLFSFLTVFFNIFIGYNANRMLGLLDKISDNIQVDSISLVALKSNNITISDISLDEKIGAPSDEVSSNSSKMIEGFLKENGISNELTYYDSYNAIVEDLYNEKIRFAFLPTEFGPVLAADEEYSDVTEKIGIIKTYELKFAQEQTIQKSVMEPFTILFMGVDNLSSSYNADTLMVVTFNPNTLSSTILSIPRDTYTTIACTGKKHKINSSGWSGDKCVVSTIEKYLDIDIDYYAKVNFKGLVELVDLLGGIDVDVPYAFCEQNSERKWGKNTVYLDSGKQTLNGEQALALTRNRHYWTGKCDKKYTSTGIRNDFVRGQNQQLVFKSILNKMKSINSIDTIYKMLDMLGDNMVTNMSTDTILSLYNVGKDILIKINAGNRDISQIVNIQKLKFTSYTKTIKIGNLNLSTVINTDNSIKAVVKSMKVNLELVEETPIKTFSFDINEGYEEKIVGNNIYGGSDDIVTLPNFVGKSFDYANSWASINRITIKPEYKYVADSKYFEGEILEQSVKANTDISNIKTVVVTVVTKVDNTGSSSQKTEEGTKQEFTYEMCLVIDTKDLSQCNIKNYVGSNLSSFKTWLNKTNLSIPVEYVAVSGEKDKIISQNISGITIFDIINGNKTIEITYGNGKNEEESLPIESEQPTE